MSNVRALVTTAVFLSVSLSAQTFDNSGNSLLKGTYFVRELMFMDINPAGYQTTAHSAVGTVVFDGQGKYSFSGQVMTSGAAASAVMSISGTYHCSANQLLKMQSLFHGINGMNDLNSDYGGVGVVGPNAFVASATEGQNYNVLIGIPLAPNSHSVSGSYDTAYFSIPQNNAMNVRTAAFTLDSDGKGGFGNVSVTGSAGNLNNSILTQTNTGVSYTLAANGTGTVNFGTASLSQLVGGAQTFAVSADGNLLLGGSPNDFDLLIGLRPVSGNSALQGAYFMAGMWDSVKSATAPNYVAGLYGSMTATASGLGLLHWRYNQSNPGQPSYPFDYTFDTSIAGSSGIGTGANGQAGLILGGAGFYQIVLALQAPAFSGSGVFLHPLGILSTASYSPITTPIAPLQMVSIYGSGMSNNTVAANGYPLSNKLGETQVLMNGTAAPLVYVSPGYIVALVPSTIHPQSGQPDNAQWVKVQIVNQGEPSNTTMVRVGATSPGVFTASQNGIGDGAILHADNSPVDSKHPARPGETVQIYLTGLGTVTPAVGDGDAAIGLTSLDNMAYVGIDNQFVTPTYAGLAPGYAGLYQLNVAIPASTRFGDVPLSIVVPSVIIASSATIPIAGSSTPVLTLPQHVNPYRPVGAPMRP